MTESDTEIRPYELAVHINADLETADIIARINEIEKLVESSGAKIKSSKEAKKMHLSYPINHKYYGYFSVFDLDASPDSVESINTKLKMNKDILRFLITKIPFEGADLRTLGIHRVVRARTTTGGVRKTDEKKLANVGEEKQMEKDLESVLEKI